MSKLLFAAAILLGAGAATADELTMMVEKDLAILGYATGPVDGEETMETVIAISKFQAEHNMEVTGEVTPQLAGVLSATVANPNLAAPAPAAATAPAYATTPAYDPTNLQAAQQACLQEKIAAAQAANKKKRGFGKLLRAVTRTASQNGNVELAQSTHDVYSASATADDLAGAARDLGLTEDEVAACENPY
ncbi:MAG: peptidoglycan-binding protein [Woeseiaceae bacterium]|nr:peptidoglycan-binding protein [Woeseiaceae bacterium]